jgi:hypothetical protein
MNPRSVFEAVMRSNGHTDFSLTATGRYRLNQIQTRWKYFLLGWEMRGANAEEV